MKTINCAECNVEYSYEPNPNYPDKRKYCANCSEKKKVSWDQRSSPEAQEDVPKGEPLLQGVPFETVPMNSQVSTNTETTTSGGFEINVPAPKPTKTYELTDGNIRIGALRCAVERQKDSNEFNWELVKRFERYIRNGE